MFAVIKTGGKQHQAYLNKVLCVEKLDQKVGEIVTFTGSDVLLFSDGENTSANPDTKVEAEILEHKRLAKIIIFKKKRRKGYRRTNGHRQYVTILRVKSIA